MLRIITLSFSPESLGIYILAGLLTLPFCYRAFPSSIGTVARIICNRAIGITAAGTVADFHSIPF